MKAVVWGSYGEPEVLTVRQVSIPTPTKNEILIRVKASTVTAGDAKLRRFDVPLGLWLPTRLVFGLTQPRRKVMGMEFAGEVISVGEQVSEFIVGDHVFGTTGIALGANAEYLCIREDKPVVKIPKSISFPEAVSLIFGGLTAANFLTKKIKTKKGAHILINGASGAVGTSCIQLGKHLNAKITAICSKGNSMLVRSLGADTVINYEDGIPQDDARYDVILDAVGNLSYPRCKKQLVENGRIIFINTNTRTMFSTVVRKELICGVAEETKAALNMLISLFESGAIRPVIDKTFPLDSIVEAHRYVDSGRKKGSVVLVNKESG